MRIFDVDQIASLRDLRAHILEVALVAKEEKRHVTLRLTSPRLQVTTIESLWTRATALLTQAVRDRLTLAVEPRPSDLDLELHAKNAWSAPQSIESSTDYTYEILRFLLNEVLGGRCSVFTPTTIQQTVGASAPTVRRALRELANAGVIELSPRGAVRPLRTPPVPWTDLLGRLGAAPKAVRFSYIEGGGDIHRLLSRTEALLQKYRDFALSGVAAALRYQPSLDLVGLPRLDLVASTSHETVSKFINDLEPRLKPEPNPLAQAAVVIARTNAVFPRFQTFEGLRLAGMGDIVLALEDARLYDLAHAFTHRDSRRWSK